MALTKLDTVESIYHQIGFTKKQSVETIETILEIIKKALEPGEDVLVSRFGKFCVKDNIERRGRNPTTGDDLIMPEGNTSLHRSLL